VEDMLFLTSPSEGEISTIDREEPVSVDKADKDISEVGCEQQLRKPVVL
jgi:hypothetical protein